MWNSVFKRDFMSFFYGASAYFILAVYSLMSAIATFFWGEYLITANNSLISFFAFQPQIMAVIIPAITMRSWSEERRNGTIENLLTFPITAFHLVIAKFAAAYAISMVMLLFSLPFLITSSLYFQIDWGGVFCSYLGAMGAAAVLTAAGCVVSALVSIPAAAYLLGLLFGILWINFNWGWLITSGMKNVPFYFERVLNFGDVYQNFLNGQLNLAGIFYFVSLPILLLFLNWLIVDNRRVQK